MSSWFSVFSCAEYGVDSYRSQQKNIKWNETKRNGCRSKLIIVWINLKDWSRRFGSCTDSIRENGTIEHIFVPVLDHLFDRHYNQYGPLSEQANCDSITILCLPNKYRAIWFLRPAHVPRCIQLYSECVHLAHETKSQQNDYETKEEMLTVRARARAYTWPNW